MNTHKTSFVIRVLGKAFKTTQKDEMMTREMVAEIANIAPRHIQAIDNEKQASSIQLLYCDFQLLF